MRTGTITDGQSMDVKTVSAMRAAGGYAGTMESGSASSFGSIQLFGDKGIKLDLGQMLDVAQVFVARRQIFERGRLPQGYEDRGHR